MWTKQKVTFFLKNRPYILHKLEETKSKINIQNCKYTLIKIKCFLDAS